MQQKSTHLYKTSNMHTMASLSSIIMQNEEVSIPCQAVLTAAKLCESVRKKMAELQAMTKSDRSPVTIADYGSQAIICKMLSENFPNDVVVAEEDANDLKLSSNKDQLHKITNYVKNALGEEEEPPSSSSVINEENVLKWIDHGNGTPCSSSFNQRFWTLDPIDGTKGFLRGDQYAICLALIDGGNVKIGIIACPALELKDEVGVVGHLFVAEQGKGAWRAPLWQHDDALSSPLKRIHVNSQVTSLVQSFESSHGNHDAQQAVAQAVGLDSVLLMDSQAKYTMVASGQVALYLRLSSYAENIWDHAAGVLMVEEAGGKVSDKNGKQLQFTSTKMKDTSGVVVTNGVLLQEKVVSSLKNY